ncbi:hypothetical protein D3C85_1028810 [compost metagenome]
MAAHRQAHGAQRNLIAAGTENRPLVRVAEQAVGRTAHVRQVLGMSTDAAAQTEHRLNENRRLEQPALQEVRSGVQVTNVIALNFKAGAVFGTGVEDVSDVAEGIAKDPVVTLGEVWPLPVVLELGETIEHLVQPEVHRSHVQRRQLRLELRHRLQAFFHAHGRRTAGGDVDHHVTLSLDLRQKLTEQIDILARPPINRIASMQVNNRCAGLGGTDGGVGDFLRRDRQVWRHRRRMDGASDGAGDDDRAFFGHECSPFLFLARKLLGSLDADYVRSLLRLRSRCSEVLDVAIHTDGLAGHVACSG